MNSLHRDLHSPLRRRKNNIVIFIILATGERRVFLLNHQSVRKLRPLKIQLTLNCACLRYFYTFTALRYFFNLKMSSFHLEKKILVGYRKRQRESRSVLAKSKHKHVFQGWGGIPQWLAYLFPDLAAPGLVPSVPKKIVDVAEVNQQYCFEES